MNGDRRHGCSTNKWAVLSDTISLRETCGHLLEQSWEMAGNTDEDAPSVIVVGARDKTEFVFLELGVTVSSSCTT